MATASRPKIPFPSSEPKPLGLLDSQHQRAEKAVGASQGKANGARARQDLTGVMETKA